LSTCKKYPEDPHRSLKWVEWRLSGEWQIDYIIIDDVNVTDLYSDSIGASIKDGKVEFKFNDSQDDNKNKINHSFNNSPPYKHYVALFNLEEKKKYISIYENYGGDTLTSRCFRNLYHSPGSSWKIKELYKKNLRLELYFNGIHYEIYYRKK
jgi:hypothetical protein